MIACVRGVTRFKVLPSRDRPIPRRDGPTICNFSPGRQHVRIPPTSVDLKQLVQKSSVNQNGKRFRWYRHAHGNFYLTSLMEPKTFSTVNILGGRFTSDSTESRKAWKICLTLAWHLLTMMCSRRRLPDSGAGASRAELNYSRSELRAE